MENQKVRNTISERNLKPVYGLPKPRSGTVGGPRGSVRALVDMYENKVRETSLQPQSNNIPVGRLSQDKLLPYMSEYSKEGYQPMRSTTGVRSTEELLDMMDLYPTEPIKKITEEEPDSDTKINSNKKEYIEEERRTPKFNEHHIAPLAKKVSNHDLLNLSDHKMPNESNSSDSQEYEIKVIDSNKKKDLETDKQESLQGDNKKNFKVNDPIYKKTSADQIKFPSNNKSQAKLAEKINLKRSDLELDFASFGEPDGITAEKPLDNLDKELKLDQQELVKEKNTLENGLNIDDSKPAGNWTKVEDQAKVKKERIELKLKTSHIEGKKNPPKDAISIDDYGSSPNKLIEEKNEFKSNKEFNSSNTNKILAKGGNNEKSTKHDNIETQSDNKIHIDKSRKKGENEGKIISETFNKYLKSTPDLESEKNSVSNTKAVEKGSSKEIQSKNENPIDNSGKITVDELKLTLGNSKTSLNSDSDFLEFSDNQKKNKLAKNPKLQLEASNRSLNKEDSQSPSNPSKSYQKNIESGDPNILIDTGSNKIKTDSSKNHEKNETNFLKNEGKAENISKNIKPNPESLNLSLNPSTDIIIAKDFQTLFKSKQNPETYSKDSPNIEPKSNLSSPKKEIINLNPKPGKINQSSPNPLENSKTQANSYLKPIQTNPNLNFLDLDKSPSKNTINKSALNPPEEIKLNSTNTQSPDLYNTAKSPIKINLPEKNVRPAMFLDINSSRSKVLNPCILDPDEIINEIDILCVNCYECIPIDEVDLHSKRCIKPILDSPELSHADIRIRKMLKSISSRKIQTTGIKYELYCNLEECSIAILETSMVIFN